MPTKRRFLLFLVVLAVMLLIKYAVSQEAATTVGWDPAESDVYSIETWIYGTMFSGLFWGMLAGISRIFGRNQAARAGRYFSGDLVTLSLH